MKIVYRISDAGYNKIKPEYINNKNCLINAYERFRAHDFIIIGDNLSNETRDMVSAVAPGAKFIPVSIGHGAGTFNLALDYALKSNLSDDEIIYFLENDYLHTTHAAELIQEGIILGAHYVTGYDHPDKYIPGNQGGNKFIEQDGGELTKIYLTKNSHWKITNSTTMTFASKVKTLREDEPVLRKFTQGTHPFDFEMFLELRSKGRILISSIPGFSTHGETQWLAPLIKWNRI